jgi:CheY-like chemotaxis protein
LAGGIAHDFNNLVTAIKGAAAELQEGALPHEKVVECAREIEHAADRAASLTAQLLAFSRRQMLRPQLFDLGAHLRAIEPSLRIALDGIGKLRMDVDPQLGSVHADPIQVERALLNLVVNARDAIRGRPNGAVTITARNADLEHEFADWKVKPAPGPYIRVDIADNGPGIDPTIREHLFEPFFTTKAMSASAGFGLATTFGIVKQSNGYIWTHPAPQGGTVFSVYLPRAVPASVGTTRAAVAPEAASGPGGNERILLVEDEDAIRRVAKRSLELAGYRITEAANGAAALRLAEQNEFDLLLTDIVMPEMLGTTLVQRLKDRFPRMPVLFMSGHSEELFKDGVIDASTPFLAKPFTPPQLAEKVRETLARSKRAR